MKYQYTSDVRDRVLEITINKKQSDYVDIDYQCGDGEHFKISMSIVDALYMLEKRVHMSYDEISIYDLTRNASRTRAKYFVSTASLYNMGDLDRNRYTHFRIEYHDYDREVEHFWENARPSRIPEPETKEIIISNMYVDRLKDALIVMWDLIADDGKLKTERKVRLN